MRKLLHASQWLNVLMLIFFMLIGNVSRAGAEEVYYTLDGTSTGGSNAYADASEITQSSITWQVTGNTTTNPWRIGGKSLTNIDRPVYSATAMPSAINKVDLTVGAASSITVNSLKLIVASDANFNNKLDEVTASFTASSTITFQPTTGTEWATGSYYKFIFNVTVSVSSNKFVEFKKAEFYSSAVDNRTPVNMTGFSATSTTLIKGETTSTTVTNDQSGWTAAYTYSSSKESVATVDAGVITAVGKGTATITATLNVAANDENYKAGETTSKTIDITVNNPTHTATFSINGTTSTADFEEDAAINFPTDIADINGKTFVGWVTETIDGVTDTKPTLLTSATMGEADVTYFAVFATKTEGNYTEVTDELTRETTGVEGTSYTAWSNKSLNSDAVYAGQSAGGNSSIQLRNTSPSGIITTTSGGKIGKINVTWNSQTSNGRYLYIYGSNTAYTSTTDLYDSSKKGTKIGQLNYVSSDNTTTEVTISGDYEYVGVLASGALYIPSISFTWVSGVPDTYSAYCTTVVADERQEAGISFAESAYTAELMGEFTSPVLTNPNNLTVVWSSSEESVATVADGIVTLVGVGETIINAAFEGNEQYKGANASYTLTVQDSRIDSNPEFAEESITVNINATEAAPTLTKTGDGAVTYASDNTGIATVDASTGVVTGVAAGTTTITATVAATNTHKLGTASFTVTVIDPNGPGTEDNPYTVAQARAAIDAGTGVTGVYATGIVSEIVTAYNSEYGNISYNISTDGLTTSDQLQAFRGKSYNGENFTSEDDIKVGDVVVIYGNLTKYNTTYEFAANNQLVSLERTTIDNPTITLGDLENIEIEIFWWDGNDYVIVNSGETVSPGTEVFIVPTVADGYTLDQITATANGNPLELTESGFGEYSGLTFTMPSNNVIINATVTQSSVTNKTLSNANIVAAGDGDSGYKDWAITDTNSKTWNAYAIKNSHSNATSAYHYLQIKKYASGTAYYIQIPEYGSKITSIEMTVSGSSKPMDGGSNTATLYFSADNTIAAEGEGVVSGTGSATITIDCSSLNLNTGYITASGAVRIWDVNVIYEEAAQTESVTVSTAGFATYCSENALDFTGKEIKAFIGTVNGTSLTFNQINQVPAGTGILLYKEGGATEEIPVIASAVAVESNCLVGVTTATTITADDYILSRSSDGVGFYKAGSHTSLGANKAYIPAETGNTVKSFAISFGDADGIQSVENGQLTVDSSNVYNLAGQRMSKLQKGVNIVNGRKVMVK